MKGRLGQESQIHGGKQEKKGWCTFHWPIMQHMFLYMLDDSYAGRHYYA